MPRAQGAVTQCDPSQLCPVPTSPITPLGWQRLRMSKVVPCGDTEELEPPVPGLVPCATWWRGGPGTAWHWLVELESPRCCTGQRDSSTGGI